METKRYYYSHLHVIDNRPSPYPEETDAEVLVFLAIKIQMRHCILDKPTDYWATTN